MDWQDHMKQVAVNWLTKGDDTISLEPEMLMLFGNPDLFQEDQLSGLIDHVTPQGVFYRGIYRGRALSYCRPLFGAPIVALYVEVAALLGVKKIVACGYVGGVHKDVDVGSYVIPSGAQGLDGCTRAYSPEGFFSPAHDSLTSRLCGLLDSRGVKYTVGPIVSIDTLMLENDEMIRGFAGEGYYAIDLETACLYAVATRLGLQAASIHIVSDSPGQKNVDKELRHEASFVEQVDIAVRGLVGG